MTTAAILYGAFDRHNLGDLLLAHVSAALLGGTPLTFTGLAARDLRAHGGHCVRALAEVASSWRGAPPALIHVGGELLTCHAWQAAVMLQPAQQARQAIAYFEPRPQEQLQWVRRTLGTPALAPYAAPIEWIPPGARVVYHAVGGVDLAAESPALREEVTARLRAADLVSARDRLTLAALQQAGIEARLVPDPALLVEVLFRDRIARRAKQGEVAALRAAWPDGFVALQLSADFGDDRTLDTLAAQIDALVADSGCGVVCFCAGIAPWHDDPRLGERLMARRPEAPLKRFGSVDVWDLCALISASRAYAGSSLHGRLVAMAFGVPRVNLRPPASPAQARKLAAVAEAWEPHGVPIAVPPNEMAQGVRLSMAVEAALRQETASRLVQQSLAGFAPVQSLLGLTPTALKNV
ncbi:polysaccharide pyruvyl transferase family protein [Piscinibacter sp. XHJ-5]|uniref:polysaccharide pyruvyl transferase family protein n=1 Tax=Piscinibacter sp. XHJ-5 TaxID=3037797 RepID=UPI0024528860|nr:polysaccharide pyruvyl transferase family protein [Piscinibacter sp. XHJ-5]